jgi:hypothetical protein
MAWEAVGEEEMEDEGEEDWNRVSTAISQQRENA